MGRSRKAAVVAAVSSGMLTLEEARRRYQMSEEEFLARQRAFEKDGILGLCVGYVQQYRSASSQVAADQKTKHSGKESVVWSWPGRQRDHLDQRRGACPFSRGDQRFESRLLQRGVARSPKPFAISYR